MDIINGFLNKVFFQNTILEYLVSLGLFIGFFILIKVVGLIVVKKIKGWAKGTATLIDDLLVSILEKRIVPFLYLVSLYVAIQYLKLPKTLDKALELVVIFVLTVFTILISIRFVEFGFDSYAQKTGRSETFRHSLMGILKVIKFILWGLGLVFFLDNLGFDIAAVIAGLGVGGVAVALAAQAVLGDLFSYFSIIFDRPFEVGDFIIVGDLLGTIEHVGIKTTRIRSLGGEQLIFSNSDLTNSRVKNYKRMERRRVVFKLGVTYDTPLAKLREIPKVIENVIKNTEDTIFDRAHFFSYADFSLVFEIVYYVIGPDYNKYMDIQQKINFAIKEEFEKRSIEFAFPTQTLHLKKEGE
ncbi:MAG: mechanosensitive ion channel family protein [Candidatus Omnitrophica bacterium]|nr:mechanosensitive ion channel family protein [Candidatus Omnitrophota bacterium]MCF7894311.1 mechanosensitive ion channel family protein [Candidatus Omnitrophota bacterium]